MPSHAAFFIHLTVTPQGAEMGAWTSLQSLMEGKDFLVEYSDDRVKGKSFSLWICLICFRKKAKTYSNKHTVFMPLHASVNS